MLRAIVFIGIWVLFAGYLGYVWNEVLGSIIACAVVFCFFLWAWFFAAKCILSMCGARHVEAEQSPVFYQVMIELMAHTKFSMPQLYVVEAEQPNAFALGHSPHHASLIVTSGLLRVADGRMLRAVLAHEMAHIQGNETALSGVVVLVTELFGFFSRISDYVGVQAVDARTHKMRPRVGKVMYMLQLLMTFLAAVNVHVGVSRAREYEADMWAVGITRDRDGYIDMLQKMNAYVEHSPIEWLEKRPVLGHLMTINGLSRSVMNDFFLTQPTIKSRIEHLMALE